MLLIEEVVTYPRSVIGLGTCRALTAATSAPSPSSLPLTCDPKGWEVTVSTLALPWTLQASRHNPTTFLTAMNQ